jgi:alpha 1,2-mannosyltransferase
MDATRRKYRDRYKKAAAEIPAYPGGFRGTGIVTCGANKYLPYLWILVRSLRHVGCRFPIELWHLRGEVDDPMRTLFAPYDVTFRCAEEIDGFGGAIDQPVFMIKPWAILHSRFRHVLFLDADNSTFGNPSFLFRTAEYREHGAIFWPDCISHGRKIGWSERMGGRRLFRDFGVEVDWSREFESGQLMVDKARHWRALCLTMHFNAEHAYYYRFLLGDKDTFRLAFELEHSPYFLVPNYPVHCLARVQGKLTFFSAIQHWPPARPVFAHSMGAWRKWLRGDLLTVEPYFLPNVPHDFLEEILAELRSGWEATDSEEKFQQGQLYVPRRAATTRLSRRLRA